MCSGNEASRMIQFMCKSSSGTIIGKLDIIFKV